MFTASKLLQGALENYQKKNGHLPRNIIFYRDGIGMGSYEKVKKKEILPILKMLEEISKNPKEIPKLVYFVVNKRINQRFYSKDSEGNLCNPQGGLIVD